VFEGTGEAVGAPDFVTDQAAAVCDELSEGPQGGALGLQGLELVPVFAEECDLECRIGGIGFGSAGRKRCAVLDHGERMDGQEHEDISVAPCRHAGPFLAFQAHRDRVSVAARAQGLDPRGDGFRAGREAQERTPCSPSGVSAAIVCGIRPIEADKRSQCFLGSTCHGCPPGGCESGTKGQAGVRAAKA